MKEVKRNIWDLYDSYVKEKMAKAIVIPTNGTVKKDGCAVMGAGLAYDAKKRWPDFPKKLGHSLQIYGNVPMPFDEYKIITFPVKHNWWEKADIGLIELSARTLRDMTDNRIMFSCIFLPHVGCGNGKLNWKDVKPILERHLTSDVFVVVRQ